MHSIVFGGTQSWNRTMVHCVHRELVSNLMHQFTLITATDIDLFKIRQFAIYWKIIDLFTESIETHSLPGVCVCCMYVADPFCLSVFLLTACWWTRTSNGNAKVTSNIYMCRYTHAVDILELQLSYKWAKRHYYSIFAIHTYVWRKRVHWLPCCWCVHVVFEISSVGQRNNFF